MKNDCFGIGLVMPRELKKERLGLPSSAHSISIFRDDLIDADLLWALILMILLRS